MGICLGMPVPLPSAVSGPRRPRRDLADRRFCLLVCPPTSPTTLREQRLGEQRWI